MDQSGCHRGVDAPREPAQGAPLADLLEDRLTGREQLGVGVTQKAQHDRGDLAEKRLVDAELAQVSLSLIPGDYGAQMGYGSMRSQMMFGDIEITDPEVVSKSWPEYWQALDSIPARRS